MTEEAEFARTFGEDAEHVEIPENILAGESFLDMCLASSSYVSTRKISVKWRDETFGVNTATDQKIIAMPSKATVRLALGLPKVNNEVVVTHAHYARIVELDRTTQITLQCKLYLEQQDKSNRMSAILRGALDVQDAELENIIGTNMEGLQTQAAAQNLSISAVAMDRVMTNDQRLRTTHGVDSTSPEFKKMLLAAQLAVRANPDDPKAGEKAMAHMVNELANATPVVESCADDGFFEDADFIMLQRYKRSMLKDFQVENIDKVLYKLKKIAERAAVLSTSNAVARSGPGLTQDAIDNLLAEELESLTNHGGVLDGPSRDDLDSARGSRPPLTVQISADTIAGNGTTRGHSRDHQRLQDTIVAPAYINPFQKDSANSPTRSSARDPIDLDETHTLHTAREEVDETLLDALDNLHFRCRQHHVEHTASPTQMYNALVMTGGSTADAMMLLHIINIFPQVRTLSQAQETFMDMNGEHCRVDKVAVCLDYVSPESPESLLVCIAFIDIADPSISVDRVHTILKQLTLEAAKPRVLKRQISDYGQMETLRDRTCCENYDHLTAALRTYPFDIDDADVFVRVCMELRDRKVYSCVEVAIRTFNNLDQATRLQNQSHQYRFMATLAMLTDNLKPPPDQPPGPVKVTLTLR
tara:strand:+ start:74 stop:2005 length:1932 start_codon:yes stop_codon:yes gene_type:complete